MMLLVVIIGLIFAIVGGAATVIDKIHGGDVWQYEAFIPVAGVVLIIVGYFG